MDNPNTPAFWDTQFKKEYKAWRESEYSLVRWQPFRFATIASLLPKTEGRVLRILDIGCGLGHLARFLSAQDPLYIVSGTDFSPFAVEMASTVSRGFFKEAPADKQPFDDPKFDVVIAADVIEHLSDIPAFLEEVRRITKPDGTVIISTPEKKLGTDEKWSEEHVTEFTSNGLMNAMSQICTDHVFSHPVVIVEPETGISHTDPTIYYAGKVQK